MLRFESEMCKNRENNAEHNGNSLICIRQGRSGSLRRRCSIGVGRAGATAFALLSLFRLLLLLFPLLSLLLLSLSLLRRLSLALCLGRRARRLLGRVTRRSRLLVGVLLPSARHLLEQSTNAQLLQLEEASVHGDASRALKTHTTGRTSSRTRVRS